MGVALDIQILLGGASEHQGKHHLREQLSLQMWFGFDRLAEPRLDLALSYLGDRITLALGSATRFGISGEHLPIPCQSAEGRIHLSEGQWFASTEEAVVLALQVVAVTGLSVEQTEEGKGDAHTCESTLSVYT